MVVKKKSADMNVKKWLALRKKAALRIDPKTAKVMWRYGWTEDPYSVVPDLPVECQQAGREEFARSPGSDIWVWFGDLPIATQKALWEKHGSFKWRKLRLLER